MASKNINDLKPGQTYVVQARTRKSDGTYTDWSNSYTFSTPSAIVYAPNNLLQTALTGSGMLISGPGFTTGSGTMYIDKYGLNAFDTASNRTVYIESSTGNAYFAGSVVATSGSIGGFSILIDRIVGGSSPNIAGIYPSGDRPFFAGATDTSAGNAKFYVTNSGSVIASAASLVGPIIASTVTASNANFQMGSTGSIVGGAIMVPQIAPYAFTVDSQGNMVATSASIVGNITASAGSIGGWGISSSALTSGSVGFYAPVAPSANEIAIFAGSAITNRSTAPFRVDYSGNMTATNANISGSISATSGSIGGFSIGTNTLSASNIVLSSTTGFNLGSGQFTVNQSGAMTAQNATIAGNINAQSGSITGDLTISSTGRLIAGSLSQGNFVIVSSSGITGASASIPVFTLPTDGSSPTIGHFRVVQTGLQGLGQVTISNASVTNGSSVMFIPITAASTIFAGMSISGSGVQANATITQVAGSNVFMSLTASANSSGFSASAIPNANMVVGVDLNNNITIRGQNAPGVPGAIFTRIGGTSTTASTGTGFYIDNQGYFNVGSALTWNPSSSVLTVVGSGSFTGNINATSGSFTGNVTAGDGTIGGISINSDSISAQSSGYYSNVTAKSPAVFLELQSFPFVDSSPNNYTLVTTGTGAATPVVGFNQIGRTYYSASTDTYSVRTTTSGTGSWAGINNNFTVEFWKKMPPLAAASFAGVLSKNNFIAGLGGWTVTVNGTGNGLYVRVDSDTNANQLLGNGVLPVDGNWHHYAFTIGTSTVGPVTISNASVTNGSSVMFIPVAAASTIFAGMRLSGSGVQTNTMITQITGSSVSMSLTASATASGFAASATSYANMIGNAYYDGIFAGSANLIGTTFNTSSVSLALPLSNKTGYIDEVAIYPSVLSAAQILDNYSSGKTAAGFSISQSGSIVATSGSIGGWSINSGSLAGGSGASAVGLVPNAASGGITIFAGNSTPSSAPFYVTNTGNLLATSASISGNITASVGSIGGFLITASALRSNQTPSQNSLAIYDPSFEGSGLYKYWLGTASSNVSSGRTALSQISGGFDGNYAALIQISTRGIFGGAGKFAASTVGLTFAKNPDPNFDGGTSSVRFSIAELGMSVGASYTFSAYLQYMNSSASPYLKVNFYSASSGSGFISSSVASPISASPWARSSLPFVVPATTSYVDFSIIDSASSQTSGGGVGFYSVFSNRFAVDAVQINSGNSASPYLSPIAINLSTSDNFTIKTGYNDSSGSTNWNILTSLDGTIYSTNINTQNVYASLINNQYINNVYNSSNTSIGANALPYSYGNYNIGIGIFAASSNFDGSENIAIGRLSLTQNFSSSDNVAVGTKALTAYSDVVTGGNTAIGGNAGQTLTTGQYNLFLGWKADGGTSANGTVAIGTDSAGNGAIAANTNDFVLGTSNHTVKAPGISGRTATSGIPVYVNSSTGTLGTATSTFMAKANIVPLNNITELSQLVPSEKIGSQSFIPNYRKILDITPVRFDFINPEDYQDEIGFIAEDIADKLPQVSRYGKNGEPSYFSEVGIMASMLAVMQEQEQRINQLTASVVALQNAIIEQGES